MVTRKTAKEYGAETQELVAVWYRRLWPAATSAGAGAPGRDVLNVPVDIEVKGTTKFEPLEWCRQQLKRGRKPDDVLPGHTVLRPKGYGPAHLPGFMVLRRLEDDTAILAELLMLRRAVARLEARTEFLIPAEEELRAARRHLLEHTDRNGLMSQQARAELEELRAQDTTP